MTPGECSGCQRAPVGRPRFNVLVIDKVRSRTHTQLLCATCARDLLGIVIGRSVERTPQAELDILPRHDRDEGWPEDAA